MKIRVSVTREEGERLVELADSGKLASFHVLDLRFLDREATDESQPRSHSTKLDAENHTMRSKSLETKPIMVADSISQSLLRRVRNNDLDAWKQLCEIYSPWITSILVHKCRIQKAAAEDITEETMWALPKSLATFSDSGEQGSFRGWLGKIVKENASLWWRQQRKHLQAAGESENLAALEQVRDPDDMLVEAIEIGHNAVVVAGLLSLAESALSREEVEAYRFIRVDGLSGKEVAIKLGKHEPGWVYLAVHRVESYLKTNGGDLID